MKKAREVREQIQEDIIAYFDHPRRERHVNPTGDVSVDELCQIVVDNFEHLEYKPAPEQQYK